MFTRTLRFCIPFFPWCSGYENFLHWTTVRFYIGFIQVLLLCGVDFRVSMGLGPHHRRETPQTAAQFSSLFFCIESGFMFPWSCRLSPASFSLAPLAHSRLYNIVLFRPSFLIELKETLQVPSEARQLGLCSLWPCGPVVTHPGPCGW